MLAEANERPGVEEQYQTAGNTSDLTVAAERRGAGDVLIAAGWSPSRVGMALLRLHSEWDGAAKPRRLTEPQLKVLAETIRAGDAKAKAAAQAARRAWVSPGRPEVRARAEAARWYAHELQLLAQALKTRPAVLEQVRAWAALKGLDQAAVAPALFHWLHPTCSACSGHGLRKVPDQPALSARQCSRCHGTGQTPRPEGAARIQNWLDDCVQKARHNLRNRLHNR